MTGSFAVKDAEVFHVFQGNSEARKVKPAVEEHTAVTGREDEAVAVQPARFIGMETHGAAIKNGTNIGGAEW